ncbi:hypothetical protein, conserved [Babesia bigemina]|uniref:Uncharacterized protein n=1 Tax=Babesia bigemina TaxID=5866 RepID=A0A061D6S2_BABBI|nr:hypothetical protein, conserved [Babesia bigemina]CDR96243.1 hypothetical protein, conserved [Babesia bigemina]|eukprot:XP_012768429.1 hypothetical protein, conserved [Babesia bigemina]
MEKHEGNTASRPKIDRKRIQMSLERSIEAHRLRMLKARTSKRDMPGSLCECINCDATSMKPSMTCRKAGRQKQQKEINRERVGGFIHDVSKASSPANAQPSRRQPRYNASTRTRNVATPKANAHVPGSKKSPRKQAPEEVPNVVETPHEKGGDAYDGSIAPSTAGELVVNEANVEQKETEIVSSARQSAVLPTNACESSTTLRESARQECQGDSSRTNENSDSLLNRIARRIGSIRIVDSMGEEHRLDTDELENKILDVVDKIVNDKIVGKNAEETVVQKDDVEAQKTDEPVNVSYTPVDHCSPKNDMMNMSNVESEDTALSPKRGEFIVDEPTDSVPMNKYKNVVDVLLDYISCGVAQKPKTTPDVLKQESYVLAGPESACTNKVVSKTTDYVYSTVEKPGLFSSVFTRGETTKRSNMCCNGGGGRYASMEPPSLGVNDAVSTGGVLGFVKSNHMAFRKDAVNIAPSRQVSQASSIRNDAPLMNGAPNRNHCVPYANHANMMINGHNPYHFQYNQPQFPCNQNSVFLPQWPAAQSFQNPCHLIRPAPKMTDRQFTAPQRGQALVRRNVTAVPGFNAVKNSQRTPGSMPNAAGVPFASYAGTHRSAMANRSYMPFGNVPSPMMAVPRQATGVLYRRNTGRAHEQQVQAAMI